MTGERAMIPAMPPRADQTLSIRIASADLDEIRQRAAEAGMSQSAFIVAKCLDREAGSLSERVAELERKVAALERRRK